MTKYGAYAQLGQDIFVCNVLNWKTHGYFVEVGVGNGKLISNTYLMEKKLKWTGLLCEPNSDNIYSIMAERDAALEICPIYKDTGSKVVFHNDEIREHSGIQSSFNETRDDRKAYKLEEMTTISLNDCLNKHKSPKSIDYISIDTEGTELDIISTFDFAKYDVKIWSIEHNTAWRKDGTDYLHKIRLTMEPQGYTFIPNEFDCYFVKNKIYNTIPRNYFPA
jgi:hypothetical protein